MPYRPDFKIQKNWIQKSSTAKLYDEVECPFKINRISHYIYNQQHSKISDIRKAVNYHLSTDLTLQQKTTGEHKKLHQILWIFEDFQIYNIYILKLYNN